VGITLAGLIFVVMAMLSQVELPVIIRWIVPLLMTAWVMAMITFRGPAIAMLRQFAPTKELPAANLVLTAVFGTIRLTGPWFLDLIRQLGISLTFVLGAVLLSLGGILLWSSRPSLPIKHELSTPEPRGPVCWAIFAAGLGVGLLVNLLMRHASVILPAIAPFNAQQITGLLLLIGTIAPFPMEQLNKRIGLGRGLVASASWVGINFLLIQWGLFLGWPLLSLSIGVSLGWLFVTQVPWALKVVAPDHAGFTAGLYFGGMGAAGAIIALLVQTNTLSTTGLYVVPVVGWGLVVVGAIGSFVLQRRWGAL
jgi:hypothetical protein